MSSLPVIPSAATLTTPQQVAALAAQLVAWADTVDDVGAVREASAKWAAITEYVRRTSREGIAEAEGALRRLEMRVGQLIGPPVVGAHHSAATEGASDVDRHARHDFRRMAEHPEVVEEVIARSSDADPPSRSKVLREIAKRKLATEVADDVRRQREHNTSIGYGPAQVAEDNRRMAILSAVRDVAEAVAALRRIADPDAVTWALASIMPAIAHVADMAQTELDAIFAGLAPYARLTSKETAA